jgi:hypothetical protein
LSDAHHLNTSWTMNSDGDSSNFRPCPIAGQWWALRNPTSLVEIVWGGSQHNQSTVQVRLWSPYEDGIEATYICLSSNEFEFLWFSESFDPQYTPDNTYRMGQVYIDPQIERLFFVGPQDEEKRVRVLASWAVKDENFCRAQLYQEGPPLPLPTPGFAAHLLGDDFD